MSILSEPERIFYVGQLPEMEVNNGGFHSFSLIPAKILPTGLYLKSAP